MQSMNLEQLARIAQGQVHGADVSFEGVGTDSRQPLRGQLFVALTGERFDGHDYIAAAREAGAVGALVERPGDWGLPVCVVRDTRVALGDLARAVRRASNVRAIGVTGSNGKTTVKEMLAAILGLAGPTLYTQGNLNNDIGLPLTLFRLQPTHRYAVLEMGANHRGEIDYLARIGEPDVGLVTNAGPAHLEGFGGIEGVAHGKGEMFAALPAHATAVINADDVYAPLWRELAGSRQVLDFGLQRPAAVTAQVIDKAAGRFELQAPQGCIEFRLALPGQHNLMNALAASAAALALGVDLQTVAAGLSEVRPVQGRLNWYPARNGARLLDDTYNANPNSLKAGIDVLTSERAEPWLVLGDMGELGPDAAALHAEAGRQARAAGVARVYALGAMAAHAADAFGEGGRHYADREQLIEAVLTALRPDVAVLVKGSRSMKMEQVVARLKAAGED